MGSVSKERAGLARHAGAMGNGCRGGGLEGGEEEARALSKCSGGFVGVLLLGLRCKAPSPFP